MIFNPFFVYSIYRFHGRTVTLILSKHRNQFFSSPHIDYSTIIIWQRSRMGGGTMVTKFLSNFFSLSRSLCLFSFRFYSKSKQKKKRNMLFAFLNTCMCGSCTCLLITFWPCYHCKTLHLTWRFFFCSL